MLEKKENDRESRKDDRAIVQLAGEKSEIVCCLLYGNANIMLVLQDMIVAEKSYDSLPNFTAADAMRLLGIGRNQYIELMNQVGRLLFLPSFDKVRERLLRAIF